MVHIIIIGSTPRPEQLQAACRDSFPIIAMIYFNTASCGIPETHNSVNYSKYNSTMEGSTVSFRCTDVLLQDEIFTTMCLKNASWIPNPVLQCSRPGIMETIYNLTCIYKSLEIMPYIFIVSEALSGDGKIAVASSITVFIVTSILFFIIGCLCGLFCRRERKAAENKVAKKQIPYYDDVVLKQHEQVLELKDNVAYGPVR